MRLLHVSDTHGTFPELPPREQWDVLVHSGDFLPTSGRIHGRIQEMVEWQYQCDWLARHDSEIEDWIAGRPALACPGNHDFVAHWAHFEMLSDYHIDPYTIDGVSFTGFPYIPRDDGEWCYEVNVAVLRTFLRGLPKVDVLVSHAPPFGVLDDGLGIPGEAIADEDMPLLWLCGHVHEHGGETSSYRGTTVSNAATTWRIVEVNQ